MPLDMNPALLQQLVQRELAKEQPSYYDSQARTADPQQQGVGIAPYLALGAGQAADAISTLTTPKLREANPLGEKGALIAKAAAVPAIMYIMHKYGEAGHPNVAKTLGYIGGGLGAGAAINNVYQNSKEPK